jgi:uncharacterized membrane protein YczE
MHSARRWAVRLTELYVGLVLYGFSMGLLVASALGNMPWDVFHQGVAGTFGGSIGVVSIVVGAFVLLLWIPLRERPGLGTVSNVVVIGVTIDLTLLVLETPEAMWARAAMAVAGVVLNALATAMYVGAGLGPGPRDGLMTGLHRRTGWSIRLVRTGIEVTVVAIGFLLGGTLGLATVAYALAVGPLVQLMLPWFTRERSPAPRGRSAGLGETPATAVGTCP